MIGLFTEKHVREMMPAPIDTIINNKNPSVFDFLVKRNKNTGASQAAIAKCQLSPNRIIPINPKIKGYACFKKLFAIIFSYLPLFLFSDYSTSKYITHNHGKEQYDCFNNYPECKSVSC